MSKRSGRKAAGGNVSRTEDRSASPDKSSGVAGKGNRSTSRTSGLRRGSATRPPAVLSSFDFDLHPDLYKPLVQFPSSQTGVTESVPASPLVISATNSLEEWLRERGYKKSVTEGYLGLWVDKEAKKIWRTLRGRSSNDTTVAEVDFSRSPNHWYCFWSIYTSGSEGILASEVSVDYPGKRNACRQATWDMAMRVNVLWIKLEEGAGRARRWRFVDDSPSISVASTSWYIQLGNAPIGSGLDSSDIPRGTREPGV